MQDRLDDNFLALPSPARALLMPEILSQILMWIYLDEDTYWNVLYDDDEIEYTFGRDGALLRCGLVNKLWWEEAMRYLWAEHPGGYAFIHAFRAVDPERKPYLASCVKSLTLHSVNERYADEHDGYLRGIAFPKLHTLKLLVDICCVHVPRIEGHAIRHLIIDPRFEVYPTMYALDEDTMDIFLEIIATSFPDLEEVVFDDLALAHPGAMDRFAGRLPHLRNFDYGSVSTRGGQL